MVYLEFINQESRASRGIYSKDFQSKEPLRLGCAMVVED